MPKTYIVAEGHSFDYPADLSSYQIVKSRGGRSKLTEDELKRVKFKKVKAGDNCSDMPASSLILYVERGWVVEQ